MYLSPRTSVNQPAQALGNPGMQRGYQPLYHLDIVNRCPGCGKSHWHVGRFSAECAHCETAALYRAFQQDRHGRLTGANLFSLAIKSICGHSAVLSKRGRP